MELAVKAADNIRILSAAMVEKARSGHPGGAMGGADFIHILYSEFLCYDPDDRNWKFRDRFFLDPGHMSPMLYSVLTMAGFMEMDDLKSFRQWGSNTPGHPELDISRGIENTSGPLGQGHAMAVGAAVAERFLVARFGEWMAHRTFAFISDGGIQEEVSQGAGRIAGHLGLSNLIMFYDSNDIQLSTATGEVTSENTAAKYEAWGWRVTEIDGNDPDRIRTALKKAILEKEKPTLIIGKTIMGKGAVTDEGTSFEGMTATHGMPLGDAGASFEKTIRNLGGNPDNPFMIFDEVADIYSRRRSELQKLAAAKKEEEKVWAANNPEAAIQLEKFFSPQAPEFDYSAVIQKENQASRAASGTMLGAFAGKIKNLIVASADLSNSDKTDGFLKNSKALKKEDFSGAFLQAGVAELTMACLMNGMALHGGVIAAGGTFFVFSDYMKPAVRLAALMGLPVKYVWTHDAFRVGEDGPTHQPVEQEAQIRLMEKLQNHKGENSMLVLRPADVNETTSAWQLAMENLKTPTALILSRQNIKNLPQTGTSADWKEKVSKGAYIVEEDDSAPDVILLASGSEVATLIEGAALLREREKLSVRVVSVPSEGLFRNQPEEYQQQILPRGITRFGLTAGLPVTLAGLAGENSAVWGMNSFGFSAPYKLLDEKLGFNGMNVYDQVMKLLEK